MRFSAVHEAGIEGGGRGTGEAVAGVGWGVIETLAGCLEHVGRVRFQRIVVDNCGRTRDAPRAAFASPLRSHATRKRPELIIFAY